MEVPPSGSKPALAREAGSRLPEQWRPAWDRSFRDDRTPDTRSRIPKPIASSGEFLVNNEGEKGTSTRGVLKGGAAADPVERGKDFVRQDLHSRKRINARLPRC